MALIECDRHHAADLRWWRRAERADHIIGQLLERRGRSDRAQDIIRRFVDDGPCYLSTSWGKDSVVALHLAVRAGVQIPVVHIVQRGPHQDPYQTAVRDAFLERFPLDYHEIVVEEVERRQRETGRTPQLQIGIRRAARRFGPRWIGGLRADESAKRKRVAQTNTSCWPIRSWLSRDVYGYLAHHDLPVHPAYAMVGGGTWDRDHLRVSIIGGQKGMGTGRRSWEWHYYPDVMERLQSLGRL